MHKIQLLVAFVLTLLLLALLGALAWWGFGGLRNVFAQLETQTAIVLGASCLALLVAAGWLAGAIRSVATSRRQLGRAMAYQQLLDAIARQDDLTPPGHALLLNASPGVLHAYRDFRQGAEGATEDDATRAESFRQLVIAMRRDLGLSTYGLERADSLATLVE